MTKEIWRKVLIFPEYEVSNLGNVRRKGGRLLKKFPIWEGSNLYVQLGKKYGYPIVGVNDLVASEFNDK